MTTKRQVRAELARQGGTWDEEYETFDAPAGRRWNASQTHGLAEARDPAGTASEHWAGCLEEIQEGTYPCTEPECDSCTPEGNHRHANNPQRLDTRKTVHDTGGTLPPCILP